jgi:hypothetical protein
MPEIAIVRSLEMDVDITVTRREDAAMPDRVEPDNGGLDPRS